jgi:hypothetical protein
MIQLLPGIKSFKEKKEMKSSSMLYALVLGAIICQISINGCKYNGTEPVWEKTFTNPQTPKITGVLPAQASGGVNFITINGENFANSPGTNVVYFNNTASEVISSTPTSIVVRRPNIVTDSAVIKVVSSQALMAVKYSPYKVEQVSAPYGGFEDNITLSVVVSDKQDNLYVMEAKNVHKITPNGDKSVFAAANRSTGDAKIGPDGNLYLLGSNRAVDKVDLTTGTVTRWVQMPSGKIVKYGDFDANGNFYTGGSKTDLLVVGTDLNVKSEAGYYTACEILAVRTYKNYVYVASKRSDKSDTTKIWRHQIDAGGNLGPQELVLDMRYSSDLAPRVIKGLTFSTDGLMYIATDAANPILTLNIENGKVDYLYKGILRPYCKSFCWGAGSFIYMLNGDAVTGEKWVVYKVNVGTTGIQ